MLERVLQIQSDWGQWQWPWSTPELVQLLTVCLELCLRHFLLWTSCFSLPVSSKASPPVGASVIWHLWVVTWSHQEGYLKRSSRPLEGFSVLERQAGSSLLSCNPDVHFLALNAPDVCLLMWRSRITHLSTKGSSIKLLFSCLTRCLLSLLEQFNKMGFQIPSSCVSNCDQ